MYGLEAISAHNGWAMAVTGPLIVMSGLTILALIISQLHKVVALFDKKKEPAPTPQDTAKDKTALPNVFPDDIQEVAELYQALVDTLEQPFALRDLYQAAEQNNYPHPILTVRQLREAQILTLEGEGRFTWNR